MSLPADKLQQILDEAVNSGKECGMQLVIYRNGELAVDICAGYTDSSRTKKVTPDSLFPIFSSGKAVMATAFLMLHEEFGFSFQEKVSKYWPEFTGYGREDAKIHHILSHRTGLHLLPGVQNTSDLLAVVREYAAEHGKEDAYQAATQLFKAEIRLETALQFHAGSVERHWSRPL